MLSQSLFLFGLLFACDGSNTTPEVPEPAPEAAPPAPEADAPEADDPEVDMENSALNIVDRTVGQPTTRTELAGRCGSGECWGDASTMHVVENGGTCYLFDDITVLVFDAPDPVGQTQIWRRPGLTTCASENPDITWDGEWQGRFGDYLIGYRQMESDYNGLDIYDKATGSVLTSLELGQSMPTITTDDVLQFKLQLTEWNCPAADDPAYAACASETWGTVTQAHPSLAAYTPPTCACSSDDGMPASMFSRSIVADFTIDLKTVNLTPKPAGEPSCGCSL